jgi:hypothetical protein
MSTLSLALTLAAILGGVALLLWLAGQRWKKHLLVRRPHSQHLQRVTGTGVVVFSLMTVTLCVAAVVRHAMPHTAVGALLNSWIGLLLGFAVVGIIFLALSWALERLGYPSFRAGEERAG